MLIENAMLLIILAGIMNGSFVIPMRYVNHINHDQTWLYHSFIGLAIIPWIILSIGFPESINYYFTLKHSALLFIIISGVVFGVGQICFAYAIKYIGIALSFAINLSLGVTIGSMFAVFYRTSFFTLSGYLVTIAVFLIVCSLGMFYFSGQHSNDRQYQTTPVHYRPGWLLVMLTGITSGLQNIIFIILLTHYANQPQADNPFWVWPPFLLAAAIAMLIGFRYRMQQQQTVIFPHLRITTLSKNIGLIILMGLFFSGSLALYSLGMSQLSYRQQLLGWPLFMVLIILTSQCWGWLYQESGKMTNKKKRYKWVGVVFLIIAIIILAFI